MSGTVCSKAEKYVNVQYITISVKLSLRASSVVLWLHYLFCVSKYQIIIFLASKQ